MMDYPFDQDRDNAGKLAAKRLKDRIGGDTSSFRTVIEKDIATGNETMLRTKGGMPEITVTKPPKKTSVDRTFVFRIVGDDYAILAQRLVQVGERFLAGAASYFVAAWKKVANVQWNDVIRMDDEDETGAADVLLNRATFSGQETTAVAHCPSGIPFVHRVGGLYANTPTGEPLKSLLYVGMAADGYRGVFNILKTGQIGTAIPVTLAAITEHSANVSVKPDGVFEFYGCNVSFNFYDPLMNEVITMWSRVRTSDAPPYIFEEELGSKTILVLGQYAVEEKFPAGFSYDLGTVSYFGPLPIPRDSPAPIPGSYTRETTGRELYEYGEVSVYEDDDYGYSGTPVAMTFNSSLEIHNMSHRTAYGPGETVYCRYVFDNPTPPPDQASIFGLQGEGWTVIDFDSATAFSLKTAIPNAKKLLDVKWSRKATTRVWPYIAYYAYDNSGIPTTAVATPPEQDGPRYDTVTLNVETSDYVYCDIDEEIYITLESVIYNYVSQGPPFDWVYSDGYHNERGYFAKYVVNVRGTIHEFPLTFKFPGNNPNKPPDTLGVFETNVGENGIPYQGGTMYPPIGTYYKGWKPAPVFNPAFMGQGNCPFIAYTTKAEEANGVPHEFYLDMTVIINPLISSEVSDATRYGSSVYINPVQFMDAYYRIIRGRSGAVLYRNSGAWDYMFTPPNDKVRLQVYHGGKTDWPTLLGSDFGAAEHLTITRI